MSVPSQHMEEVRRMFGDFLQQRGRRQTPERFVVLEEIYATTDHVDADELYIRLKGRGHRVSRATVYNTLELLIACNLVVRHRFVGNQAKYERASNRQHDHLICMDCNDEVKEFCAPQVESIKEMLADIPDFKHLDIQHHSLNMYGRCIREQCPNRTPVAQGA